MSTDSADRRTKVLLNAMSSVQGGGVRYVTNFLCRVADRDDIEVHVYGLRKNLVSTSSDNIRYFQIPGGRLPALRPLIELFLFPLLLLTRKYNIYFSPGGLCLTPTFGLSTGVTMFRNMIPFSSETLSGFSLKQRIKFRILRWAFWASFVQADYVIFISQHALDVVRRALPLPEEKCLLIPHGVAPLNENEYSQSTLDSTQLMDPDQTTLTYLSSIYPYKHHQELIAGLGLFLKRNQAAPKLVFAGYDDLGLVPEILRFAEANGVAKKVHYAGALSYQETNSFLASGDAIVFASSCENCPNILLEAMRFGKPILCSSREPMVEFLQEHGFYFEPTSSLSFCLALEQLFSAESQRIREVTEAAQKRVSDFSLARQADHTIDTLTRIGTFR